MISDVVVKFANVTPHCIGYSPDLSRNRACEVGLDAQGSVAIGSAPHRRHLNAVACSDEYLNWNHRHNAAELREYGDDSNSHFTFIATESVGDCLCLPKIASEIVSWDSSSNLCINLPLIDFLVDIAVFHLWELKFDLGLQALR